MTTRTLTLTDFLLARIAEDEAEARHRWQVEPGIGWSTAPPDDGAPQMVEVRTEQGRGNDFNPFTGRMEQLPGLVTTEVLTLDEFRQKYCIKAEPSARLLAECESRHRIIEVATRPEHQDWGSPMVDVLMALALPYADHPDYRDGWRP